MPIFTLHPIEEISGRIKLFKLIINGSSPYEDFEEKLRFALKKAGEDFEDWGHFISYYTLNHVWYL